MSDAFTGQIAMFGFSFAPVGWAMCNGQIMQINGNTELFSLLGTTYGGDGQTTFALPDLQSRVPIHSGQGPGLSAHNLGQKGGVESVTLTTNELPAHNHLVNSVTDDGNYVFPDSTALPGIGYYFHYSQANADSTMAATMIAPAGGGQPRTNMQPYLALNFCICLQGKAPSRS